MGGHDGVESRECVAGFDDGGVVGVAFGFAEPLGDDHGHEGGGDAVADGIGEEEGGVVLVEGGDVVDVSGDVGGGSVDDAQFDGVEFGHLGGEVFALDGGGGLELVVELGDLGLDAGDGHLGEAQVGAEALDGGLALGEGAEDGRGEVGVDGEGFDEDPLGAEESRGSVGGVAHEHEGGAEGLGEGFDEACEDDLGGLVVDRDEDGEVGGEPGGLLVGDAREGSGGGAHREGREGAVEGDGEPGVGVLDDVEVHARDRREVSGVLGVERESDGHWSRSLVRRGRRRGEDRMSGGSPGAREGAGA